MAISQLKALISAQVSKRKENRLKTVKRTAILRHVNRLIVWRFLCELVRIRKTMTTFAGFRRETQFFKLLKKYALFVISVLICLLCHYEFQFLGIQHVVSFSAF